VNECLAAGPAAVTAALHVAGEVPCAGMLGQPAQEQFAGVGVKARHADVSCRSWIETGYALTCWRKRLSQQYRKFPPAIQ
jgi:hypothetical protein